MQAKQRNNNPPSLPLRRIGGPFRERRASHTDVPLIKHALSEASLPRGFRFAATACGLKKTGALDLAILSSDMPASAAAVFTQNLVVAAPVLISKEHLRASKGRMRAVVVNAGNANCATGEAGHAAAVRTVEVAAKRVGCAKGAGMIHPNMATMLAFVATDAAIAPSLLQKTLRDVTGRTFNAISVDGDTSTNDTLLVL